VKITAQIFFRRSAEQCNNSSKLLVWFFSVQQSARGKKMGERKIFFFKLFRLSDLSSDIKPSTEHNLSV
jgi:hypothetical protein